MAQAPGGTGCQGPAWACRRGVLSSAGTRRRKTWSQASERMLAYTHLLMEAAPGPWRSTKTHRVLAHVPGTTG